MWFLMPSFNNLSSTNNTNISEEENYFSELNIDTDVTNEKNKASIEENRLETFLQEESNSEECTALVTLNERRLMAAQTMFKKSIKVSIKSFLISLSLSFLNLFI